VLEARDKANAVYDMTKTTARLAKAKAAHDELIAVAYRTQADALVITSEANARFADEYDAAQARGDVATSKDNLRKGGKSPDPDNSRIGKATQEDMGIDSNDLSDACEVRDAEKKSPGIVKKTVKKALEEGREPTKAEVKRAVKEALGKSTSPARDAAALNDRVSKAILALAGLPPPESVIKGLRGSNEAILIHERILEVMDWFIEFASKWQEAMEDA
jgi:hypothetical protein